MILENSLFLMLLNLFVDKIPSTVIKFIKFHLNGWIFLIFGEMHKLSERYKNIMCTHWAPG